MTKLVTLFMYLFMITFFSENMDIDSNVAPTNLETIKINNQKNACNPFTVTSENLEKSTLDQAVSSPIELNYYEMFGTVFCATDCVYIYVGQLCCRVIVPNPDPYKK